MDRLFLSIHAAIRANKWKSLVVLVVLLASLAFTASRISFEEDITKLIPSNENNEQLQQVLSSVNFTDKIIVNVRKGKGSTETLVQTATMLMDSLSSLQDSYIENIQGKINEDHMASTIDFVYQNLPLFLEAEDYDRIAEKIRPDSIDAITRANYKMLVSPSGIIAKQTILKDPLGLSFMGLRKLQDLGMGDDFLLKDGFILSKDEQNILLFVTPIYSTNNTDQNTAFVERLYEIQESIQNEFQEQTSVEYYGGALVAVANASQIKTDIKFTVGIAVTVLLVIFMLFYRSIWVPLVLFTPTLFGALLSVAVLYLLRGQISAISLGIGSVLLGVTLDYSLHILTHLRNNSDVKELYADVSRPILMSSLTTALAFLCLWFVNSQALQDLGIFAACSVLGASVFALLFIPWVYKGTTVSAAKQTILDRWAAYPIDRNKFLIIGLCSLLLLSCFTYGKVIFNKDIAKLNYEPEFLEDAKERLDALTNIGSKSVYIAAFNENTEEALQKNDQVYDSLQRLASNEHIISFNSSGALVQSRAKQEAKLKRWNSFWREVGVDSLKTRFISSGATFNFKPTTFQRFYEHLSSDFQIVPLEEYEQIEWFSLNDFISTSNDLTTATSLVKVDSSQSKVVKRMFTEDPAVVMIDRQEMNERLLGNLKNDFNKLIGYSLVVVLLLLFFYYRSFSSMLVTSIPIGLSWLLTIGMMGLFHIEFNIFNIIISTFIFGLGVDYSIFMTNGLLKEYKDGTPALTTHKTSIILSVITTLFGIGVLIFAEHPALYTISIVCMIGIFSAMTISFVLQPVLFRLFIGSANKRPISLRLLLHSIVSFGYYGLGGFLLSLLSVSLMKIIPVSKKRKMNVFHKILSKFMKSVLYTNPFVKKRIINTTNVDFSKPGILIANHTSFLDILAIGMLHPKIIFLVNDWVYNSPIFGKAVQLAGFYPVSGGIDKGVEHLRKKVDQGYCLMAFPEGTRSTTNKMKRFHKGSFHLAEMLHLDIIPILIHGNSEVLPKGSFVIKDGSITIEILPRIPIESSEYGTTSREKTRKISSYFRLQFKRLRNDIEDATYFHPIVLEEYRYKGDEIYHRIRKDLKQHSEIYYTLMQEIDPKAMVLHLSQSWGQLDFLLALDGPQRKIVSYIEDLEKVKMLNHSFLTHTERKLQFTHILDAITEVRPTTIILESVVIATEVLEPCLREATILIVVGVHQSVSENEWIDLGFKISYQQENLSIFKKTT